MSFQASVASFRVAVSTALVLFCSTCAACGSDSPATCVEPLDPAGTHYGRTAGEWLADWSRWLYETPASQHPVTDTTGEHCAVNQPGGEVFYLAGTYGGPMVTRTCAVPAGPALFVPFLVWFNDNGGVPMPVPDEELPQFVEQQLANGVQLSAELDGCQLSGLERHKTSIEEFSYDCPEGDCIYSE
ncbi:MAG: hypothetical protein IT379_42935, partial [Deltaproteobacteria bacterium]|nr:hypothetical protein [Deltaproteobacteria bacterium]